MAVITISRELGSEGDKIANMLCQELGYRWVDKAILLQVAQESGVDAEAVLALERSFAKRARLVSSEMTSLYRARPTAWEGRAVLDDQTYERIVRKAIEDCANEGNVILVGRGGQMVLRDWPAAVHVLLYAPQEVRVQRLMQRLNVSKADAERQIAASDEEKKWYISHMYQNASWRDLKHYHLAINTGFVTPEAATQMIIVVVKARARA